MKILIATSEAVPFVKTGGLADVTGALFKEYLNMGEEACMALPLYRTIRERFDLKDTGILLRILLGSRPVEAKVFSHGDVFFIECAEFFDRPELYGTPEGDYPDNAARFVFFSRAVAELCMALNIRPDVIHCNDWQTGLVPIYLKTIYNDEFFSRTVSVMTIHNIGYQGNFDVTDYHLTGLNWGLFNPDWLEFYGRFNFLKAGLTASDIITTVSPAYAGEILTPEYGYGLDGVLRKRSGDLYGILNGIDVNEWDPSNDRDIPVRYGMEAIDGKLKCKKELIRECSMELEGGDYPLAAFVGRLSEQKGVDILIDSIDPIVSSGVGVIILGKGDERYYPLIMDAAKKHKGRVFSSIGYDEAFARRIYAGSDIFLMPSRYEPCGLSQMIAMRYGTIPVARRTGGLADTIIDYDPLRKSGTGFLFDGYSASAFTECLKRAFCAYADKRQWKRLIKDAMAGDFSWNNSAAKYIGLYGKALKMRLESK